MASAVGFGTRDTRVYQDPVFFVRPRFRPAKIPDFPEFPGLSRFLSGIPGIPDEIPSREAASGATGRFLPAVEGRRETYLHVTGPGLRDTRTPPPAPVFHTIVQLQAVATAVRNEKSSTSTGSGNFNDNVDDDIVNNND